MLDIDEWDALINENVRLRPEPIRVTDFGVSLGPSYFSPAILIDEQGRDWVIKSLRIDRDVSRALVTDHLVGYAARLIGAPVPEVTSAFLSPDLVSINPELAHMRGGICHASLHVARCSGRNLFRYTENRENRSRFALLSILYGWLAAEDHQFIYENDRPNLVHSVDHCHFFPEAPEWSIQSLQQASPAFPDKHICRECDLSKEEQLFAFKRLTEVSDEAIAQVAAMPPDEWGITFGERIQIAMFMARRRDAMYKAFVRTTSEIEN